MAVPGRLKRGLLSHREMPWCYARSNPAVETNSAEMPAGSQMGLPYIENRAAAGGAVILR